MSYEAFPMNPCVGGGQCGLAYRSLWCSLSNSGYTVAGSNNMRAWMADFDWDLVSWGHTYYADFSNYQDTTPTLGTQVLPDGGHPYSQSEFYVSPQNLVVSNDSVQVASQIWLGGPRPYLVLATGFELVTDPNPGAFISVAGCAFNLPPSPGCVASQLLTLPLPNPDLGYHCDTYVFGPVGPHGPGKGANYTGPWPNVAAMAADLCNNYGAGWNPNQICKPSPADPFST